MRRALLPVLLALVLPAVALAAGGAPKEPPPFVGPQAGNYERAEYLIRTGSFDEAIPLLESIIRDNPKDADSLNYLGVAKSYTGYRDEALLLYKRALESDPDHKGAHQNLGELYLHMGNLKDAEAELAALKTICAMICDEKVNLAARIAEYKAAHPAAATKTKP